MAEDRITHGSWLDELGAELPRLDGLCAEVDPELFFPDKGGTTRPAKVICGQCYDREPCLQYALDNDEQFGIWGGLTVRERRRLRPGRGLPAIDLEDIA